MGRSSAYMCPTRALLYCLQTHLCTAAGSPGHVCVTLFTSYSPSTHGTDVLPALLLQAKCCIGELAATAGGSDLLPMSAAIPTSNGERLWQAQDADCIAAGMQPSWLTCAHLHSRVLERGGSTMAAGSRCCLPLLSN